MLNPGFESDNKGHWFLKNWEHRYFDNLKNIEIVKKPVGSANHVLAFQGHSIARQYITGNIIPGHTYRVKASATLQNVSEGSYYMLARWYF